MPIKDPKHGSVFVIAQVDCSDVCIFHRLSPALSAGKPHTNLVNASLAKALCCLPDRVGGCKGEALPALMLHHILRYRSTPQICPLLSQAH